MMFEYQVPFFWLSNGVAKNHVNSQVSNSEVSYTDELAV